MTDVDMGEGPQLDHNHNAGGSDPAQPREFKIKKTRNRLPVSCEPCRIRRAKCDRERPHCSACSKRGEMEKCVYQTKGPKHGAKTDDPAGRIPVTETDQRLRNLENLITDFIDNNRNNYQNINAPPNSYPMPASSAPPGEQAEAMNPIGTVKDHLQELRMLITGDPITGSIDDGYEEKPVLLGASHGPSLDFILHQYLPDRTEVEAYLGIYFRAPFIVIPILHAPSFQQEFNEFWLSRPAVDPIFAGLLFTVLTLAAHISSVANDSASDAVDRFTNAARECIKLGGYTKPRKNIVAALLLLAQGQYVRRFDPSREVRTILTILADLAYQSGLHREPSPRMPIFEAEMRRRQFFMIRHFELQIASQFGVPTVIQYNSFDVREPQNLFDDDLKEDMTKLPEPRGLEEATPLSAFLIKARLMTIFSEVYYHATACQTDPAIEAISMRLDSEIRKEHRNVPDRYKIRPIAEAVTDPEPLILSRLTFEFLTQKSLCILHRRRMTEASDNYARKACIDAASKVIKETTDLVPEFAPGRQLAGKAWILTSTIVNDFLLACMILSLAVVTEERGSQTQAQPRRRNPPADAERMRRLIELLVRARALCIELSPRSRGAKRVGEVITMQFQRVQASANVDPSLSSYGGLGLGGINGYAAAGTVYPTPTPSSNMSQERSTHSAMSSRRGQQPQPQQQGGYDYAANIAAAAQAEPLPVPVSSAGGGVGHPGQSAGVGVSDELVTAALYAAREAQTQAQPQQQQQQHQHLPPTTAGVNTAMTMASGPIDPFLQFSTSTSDDDIDWTAFDQFIWSAGSGAGAGAGAGAAVPGGFGGSAGGYDWNLGGFGGYGGR